MFKLEAGTVSGLTVKGVDRLARFLGTNNPVWGHSSTVTSYDASSELHC
jgi:hypothetical protein